MRSLIRLRVSGSIRARLRSYFHLHAQRLLLLAAPACALLSACGGDRKGGIGDDDSRVLVVYNAGSLARPIRMVLDTFAQLNGVHAEQESAGSLETARKLTELGKIPDVIALADYEVFPQLLEPDYVSWYVQFARNRMVVAYSRRSSFASEISAVNWWRILQRSGVEVGRADPHLDPNGYRTLLTMQLAERHYGVPGLAAKLLAAAPDRNVRPKEVELVGLLQAGELDYIWSYESVAQAADLEYVQLPVAIDLSSPASAEEYSKAAVQVRGRNPGDTVLFRGEPIVYGVSIPRGAPHAALAERFVVFLLSDRGRGLLRQAKLDALEPPVLSGTGAPPAIAALTARLER